MEQIFEKLKQQGHNTQEAVIHWLREANIVSDRTQENKAIGYLKEAGAHTTVELTQLKHVLEEIARDKRKSAEDLSSSLSAQSESFLKKIHEHAEQMQLEAKATQNKMEETFEKLRQEGKNDQETLINWMKEAKIIVDKKQEDLAKQYFKETAEAKVDMDRFKEVVDKVAKDGEKSIADIEKSLSETSAKMMKTIDSGVHALKEAMKKLD